MYKRELVRLMSLQKMEALGRRTDQFFREIESQFDEMTCRDLEQLCHVLSIYLKEGYEGREWRCNAALVHFFPIL